MTAISGIGTFNEAFQNRDLTMYDKLHINCIGYGELIQNKKATNRLKDQLDIEELSKVKRKKKD